MFIGGETLAKGKGLSQRTSRNPRSGVFNTVSRIRIIDAWSIMECFTNKCLSYIHMISYLTIHIWFRIYCTRSFLYGALLCWYNYLVLTSMYFKKVCSTCSRTLKALKSYGFIFWKMLFKVLVCIHMYIYSWRWENS